jgi:tetratricopeptide (TPR) repeat protein
MPDKSKLKSHIKKNSYLVPILADVYIERKEIKRALKICQSFLKKHPDSAIGHFIIAKAMIEEGNVEMGIEHLKRVIEIDNGFLQAYYKLFDIGKSYLTTEAIKKLYEKILEINPFDKIAKKELENIAKAKSTLQKETTKEGCLTFNEATEGTSTEGSSKKIELKIPIPTFTLVEVLKQQKLYDQALQVISLLENRPKDTAKAKKIREEIEKLKAEENSEMNKG